MDLASGRPAGRRRQRPPLQPRRRKMPETSRNAYKHLSRPGHLRPNARTIVASSLSAVKIKVHRRALFTGGTEAKGTNIRTAR